MCARAQQEERRENRLDENKGDAQLDWTGMNPRGTKTNLSNGFNGTREAVSVESVQTNKQLLVWRKVGAHEMGVGGRASPRVQIL